MKDIVLGITGASGVCYARRLAQILAAADVRLHLVVTPPGLRVLAQELGLRDFSVEGLIGRPAPNVTNYACDDVGAAIASGSFPTAGMIVCPCSSHTLGAIANGLADNLLTRAAMVTLKEGRRLILVLREMPLGLVEITNMLRVAQAGAVVCPACPGFYLNPRRIEDLVDFVVGRVLDLMGLPHNLKTRWPGCGGDPAS